MLFAANSGGSQVFLGAPWIPLTLKMAPGSWRKRIALEWLAVSPHYFYRTPENQHLRRHEFLYSQWEKNIRGRQLIVDHLIRPHLKPEFTVLDYGCGPGFLVASSAKASRRVIACDISKGVLECARTLNAHPNAEYLHVPPTGGLAVKADSVDLIYSFAVIQHIEDAVLQKVLEEMRRVMKSGARALIHVVLHGATGAAGWRTETDWRSDHTLAGRAKWLVGLHCFSRDPAAIIGMVAKAGFRDVSVDAINVPNLDDDIAHQHMLSFSQP
jgi:SAM-dependent methyltransferase